MPIILARAVVQPSFLKQMVKTANADRRIGIVGPKMLSAPARAQSIKGVRARAFALGERDQKMDRIRPTTRALYRNFFKFYYHRQSFVETYCQRRNLKRSELVDTFENIHDRLITILLGSIAKLGERGSKAEHFVPCKKKAVAENE